MASKKVYIPGKSTRLSTYSSASKTTKGQLKLEFSTLHSNNSSDSLSKHFTMSGVWILRSKRQPC